MSKYYKILKNSTIVDAMESLSYVRQNLKNKVIVASAPEFANGILSSDKTTIWHLEGLPNFIEGSFESVTAVEIDEIEYNSIREVLDGGETIENEETIREPLTETQFLEKLDALNAKIEELTEDNAKLKEEIALLKA